MGIIPSLQASIEATAIFSPRLSLWTSFLFNLHDTPLSLLQHRVLPIHFQPATEKGTGLHFLCTLVNEVLSLLYLLFYKAWHLVGWI